MENVTLERYWSDPSVKAEIDAAARRERAQVLKRFLEQSTAALLGRHNNVRQMAPCEAC